MAVTRSWTAAGAAPAVLAVGQTHDARTHTRSELVWLLCASLLVAAGLGMVLAAKIQSGADVPPATVNLNTISSPGELVPLLEQAPNRDGLGRGSTRTTW